MKKFGIDISKWQGDFDLYNAIKNGVEFAVIKGGGGDDGLYTDPKFKKNYDTAKSLGIPVGAYWFTKALNVNEAVKEADYFYEKILKNRQFELPIFIDVEHSAVFSLGKKALTDTVIAWCERLEERGFWVGIYSTVYAFSAYMEDSRLEPYTHWVAQWSSVCTYPNKDILGLWQFGGEVNLLRNKYISGVVCDQNYMYKDFPALIKQTGLNGFTKSTETKPTISDSGADSSLPPEKEKKSVSVLANEVIQGLWGNGVTRKNRLTDAGYDYDAVQSLVDKTLSSGSADTVKAGDMAKLADTAVIYGTDKKFANFVYNTLLYVREISGNRAVISILPEGPITGACDVKYLIKHSV